MPTTPPRPAPADAADAPGEPMTVNGKRYVIRTRAECWSVYEATAKRTHVGIVTCRGEALPRGFAAQRPYAGRLAVLKVIAARLVRRG